MSQTSISLIARISPTLHYNGYPTFSASQVHTFTVLFIHSGKTVTLSVGFAVSTRFPIYLTGNASTHWPMDYNWFPDKLHCTTDPLFRRQLMWRGMPAVFQVCSGVNVLSTDAHYYLQLNYSVSCSLLDGYDVVEGHKFMYPIWLSTEHTFIYTDSEGPNAPVSTSSINHSGMDIIF